MEFFIDVVFEIWLSKVGQVSRRTHKLLFLSIIAAKLDFFGKGSFNVYVADIQRQIVLKFQIYHINSFEDIMVESCRKLSYFAVLLRRPESSRTENAWDLDFM